MFDFPEPPPRVTSRYRLHGWAVSLFLHVAALLALLIASFGPRNYGDWAAADARILYVALAEPIEGEDQRAPPELVTGPPERARPLLEERIQQEIARADQRTDEENLSQLDLLSQRLSQVSDERSIDALAGALQVLLGTKPRAEQPAEEPAEGEFDFDTAQFHDVRREAVEDGSWRYWSLLVDADGRATEVELSAADGPRVWETFQRIKQNPLLERVYRQIAMPLFDRMLAGARAAARPD